MSHEINLFKRPKDSNGSGVSRPEGSCSLDATVKVIYCQLSPQRNSVSVNSKLQLTGRRLQHPNPTIPRKRTFLSEDVLSRPVPTVTELCGAMVTTRPSRTIFLRAPKNVSPLSGLLPPPVRWRDPWPWWTGWCSSERETVSTANVALKDPATTGWFRGCWKKTRPGVCSLPGSARTCESAGLWNGRQRGTNNQEERSLESLLLLTLVVDQIQWGSSSGTTGKKMCEMSLGIENLYDWNHLAFPEDGRFSTDS